MSRPTFSFLFSHPAHFLALGCGSGLFPWGPGTTGTLFAWVSYIGLRPLFTEAGFAIFLAFSFAIGISAIQIAGHALRDPDHGSIVWDEIVPFWGVLFMLPFDWVWQAAAFVWFRLYDIAKPQPARWFDENMKNGLGVMLDDVIAAAYTLFTLAYGKWLLT